MDIPITTKGVMVKVATTITPDSSITAMGMDRIMQVVVAGIIEIIMATVTIKIIHPMAMVREVSIGGTHDSFIIHHRIIC